MKVGINDTFHVMHIASGQHFMPGENLLDSQMMSITLMLFTRYAEWLKGMSNTVTRNHKQGQGQRSNLANLLTAFTA